MIKMNISVHTKLIENTKHKDDRKMILKARFH